MYNEQFKRFQSHNIEILSKYLLKSFDESFNYERITRTRQRIHAHSPATKSNAFFVKLIFFRIQWRLSTKKKLEEIEIRWRKKVEAELNRYTHRRISLKYGLSNEVGKIERVAHVGHPAEQIRQTNHPQRLRHKDDG